MSDEGLSIFARRLLTELFISSPQATATQLGQYMRQYLRRHGQSKSLKFALVGGCSSDQEHGTQFSSASHISEKQADIIIQN